MFLAFFIVLKKLFLVIQLKYYLHVNSSLRDLDKCYNTIFNLQMQITYPSHHRWMKDISAGANTGFSGRVVKFIEKSLPLLEQNRIIAKIEPLREEFFDDFTPMYTEKIGQKNNAIVFDVKATTLEKVGVDFPYFGYSIHEDGKYVGGTIFSLRKDRVSYAYRTFEKKWFNADLPASPALIGEYMIAEFARDKGVDLLSHGKDRNPYGLNSAIGLAIFKLSVGCYPSNVTEGSYEIRTIETGEISEDCLILEQPKRGTNITKAYLVTTKANEYKYLQATKYPNQLAVEILYRPEL
jgi:hypothetical protein